MIMYRLKKILLIVLLVSVSCISCSKKNVRLIDSDHYKGKMYVYVNTEVHKTLFYIKYTAEDLSITLISQFGETVYAAQYRVTDNSLIVSSSSIELDRTGIHEAAKLLHSILKERLYSAPVHSEQGRVEFSDHDSDGFPRVWTISTTRFQVKAIFHDL